MDSKQFSERDCFDANRQSWDQRAAVHYKSAFYDVNGFLEGKNQLNSIELDLLGDIRGKSILHLQCHFGLDSLSLARLGAQVTGVDFSEKAIALARQVNENAGLDAHFICANVYDLHHHLDDAFDIVFTSYGVIGWLPDMQRWAGVIERFLKPGGCFVLAEFHPVVWMFDDNFNRIEYPYFNREVIKTEQQGTYTDRDAPLVSTEYGWNHSIAEVIDALLKRGLRVTAFQEFDYSPYNCFQNTVPCGNGGFYIKGYEGKLPMVYALRAEK